MYALRSYPCNAVTLRDIRMEVCDTHVAFVRSILTIVTYDKNAVLPRRSLSHVRKARIARARGVLPDISVERTRP